MVAVCGGGWTGPNNCAGHGEPANREGRVGKSGGSIAVRIMKGVFHVSKLSEMPTSYHDGSLFISAKKEMPWT